MDHSKVPVPPGSRLHLYCLWCQLSGSLSRPWDAHRLVCAHSVTNLRKDSTELGSEAAFLSPVTGPQPNPKRHVCPWFSFMTTLVPASPDPMAPDTAGMGPPSLSMKHTVVWTRIAGQEDPIRKKDVQRGQGGGEGTFHVE